MGEGTGKSNSKAAITGVVLGALILASMVGVIAFAAGANQLPKSSTATAPGVVAHLDLTIATGAGPTGDWPAFVPSSFRLPANATVVVTVTNLDDATPLPAPLAKVSGTVRNTVQVAPINPAYPNKTKADRAFSAFDPQTQVGHTITIPGLGINVPIAPHAVESFTIHTAGTSSCAGGVCMYDWHCVDPCGSGSSGWSGAMAAPGFMGGTVTIG